MFMFYSWEERRFRNGRVKSRSLCGGLYARVGRGTLGWADGWVKCGCMARFNGGRVTWCRGRGFSRTSCWVSGRAHCR